MPIPNFNGFQAAHHRQKKCQVRFGGHIAFEIVSSQKYANFNYQQVIDGNRSAFQSLFSFYRRRPSDFNFRAKIGSVG